MHGLFRTRLVGPDKTVGPRLILPRSHCTVPVVIEPVSFVAATLSSLHSIPHLTGSLSERNPSCIILSTGALRPRLTASAEPGKKEHWFSNPRTRPKPVIQPQSPLIQAISPGFRQTDTQNQINNIDMPLGALSLNILSNS